MGVFAIDLGAVTSALAPTSEAIGLIKFFGDAAGRRIVIDILAYSCAAGLFVVPIFAAVQSWAGEDRRARVIGAVNTLSAIYMVAGSLATKRLVPASAGTLPTNSLQFVGLLIGTILIVGGLTFFPALALGPLAEHYSFSAGTLF